MRKIVSLLVLALVALTFAVSCAQGSGKTVIGISKIVSHPALDAVEQGIQDELKAEKVEATFDLQNANGDPNAAASIANKFKGDKVTIAVGIATPTAQALVKAFADVKSPVIYSAITDPVDAGLVASTTAGGEYVTGYSDMSLVKPQLEFLLKIVPTVKKVGVVYAGGEANAVVLKNAVEAAAKELGLEVVSASIANSAEVKSATQSIVEKVDAFYVGTDNTVVSALPALAEVAKSKKKPIMSADPTSASTSDVLVAWGFDYYKMGVATGKLIGQILAGKKTSDFPTQYLTDAKDMSVLVNLDVAKAIGVTFPQDVVESASTVIENGAVTKK